MEKKHYTAGGNPSHAGVFILPNGNNIDIVIDHIEWREKEEINGRVESKFIAVFKPNQYTNLPMVLNKVNKQRILKLAGKGSWDILDIKNLPVTLTWESTRVGDGLRISPIPPRQKAPTTAPTPPQTLETLTTAHKNFSKCVDYLKSGGTIDNLRTKYTISSAMEETLKQALL